MSYSRQNFSQELDHILKRNEEIDCTQIANWAFKTRVENLPSIDPDVSNWMLQLGAMDMGPEFEFTKEELHEIVNQARLIRH